MVQRGIVVRRHLGADHLGTLWKIEEIISPFAMRRKIDGSRDLPPRGTDREHRVREWRLIEDAYHRRGAGIDPGRERFDPNVNQRRVRLDLQHAPGLSIPDTDRSGQTPAHPRAPPPAGRPMQLPRSSVMPVGVIASTHRNQCDVSEFVFSCPGTIVIWIEA